MMSGAVRRDSDNLRMSTENYLRLNVQKGLLFKMRCSGADGFHAICSFHLHLLCIRKFKQISKTPKINFSNALKKSKLTQNLVGSLR